MTIQQQDHSLKFISKIGHDLMRLAERAEGMDKWLARHDHVRMFAHDIYGDTEEAMMLSVAMRLHP